MIIIIISMNKSQESTVFGGRQKLTSVTKLRPETIQVSLHREPPEVGLVNKLIGSLY